MNRIFSGWLCLALAACTGAEAPGVESPEPTQPTGQTGTTGDLEIQTGECEGSPYQRSADTGLGEPLVWAEVDAQSRIVVHLDDMTANCCPSPEASLTASGSTLTLDFLSVAAEDSCDCVCIFDFQVTSDPQSAGTYTLDVIFDGDAYDPIEVVVP